MANQFLNSGASRSELLAALMDKQQRRYAQQPNPYSVGEAFARTGARLADSFAQKGLVDDELKRRENIKQSNRNALQKYVTGTPTTQSFGNVPEPTGPIQQIAPVAGRQGTGVTSQELPAPTIITTEGYDPRSVEAAAAILQDPNTTPEMSEFVAKDQLEERTKKAALLKKPTGAEAAIDREYGKEYASFVIGGGMADANKSISQLDTVINSLQNAIDTGATIGITGPLVGIMPDVLQDLFLPEAANTRDLVTEVVQRNLRIILGAQFTEKEGERLIARAYNPRLKEEENLARVKRLASSMQQAIDSKIRAANYYEEYGTLKGYDATSNVGLANIYAALDEEEPTTTTIDPTYPVITTQAEFDALPSGTIFVEDGVTRTKL